MSEYVASPHDLNEEVPLPPEPEDPWAGANLHAVADDPDPSPGTGTTDNKRSGISARDRLVTIAESQTRIGQTKDGNTFIVPNHGPNVAHFRGTAKPILAALERKQSGKTPGRGPLDEAWTAIEGIAYEREQEELPLRVGSHGHQLVVDLGSTTGEAIVIGVDGWSIQPRSPITFRRSKAQAQLPRPERNRDVGREDLWQIINVAEPARQIVWVWLLSTFIRNIPHPIIQIRGEQGSAKTSATGFLAELVDPSPIATIAPSRDDESYHVTVHARWVPAFDNVSSIPEWFSDNLCRTATGSGSLKRQHYSDNDVVVRVSKGCVILNGISLTGALRNDLAERILPLDLERPPEYWTEVEVRTRFVERHPHILAALLDDLVLVLAARDDTSAPTNYRMADFAHILAAADRALNFTAISKYSELQAEAEVDALEGDIVATTILQYMEHRTDVNKPAGKILADLATIRDNMINDHEISKEGYWPNNGASFSRILTRSGPILRANGIEYRRESTRSARTLHLYRTTQKRDRSVTEA